MQRVNDDKIIISLLSEINKDKWNNYLRSKPIPPLCDFKWKWILENTYNAETHFLIAEDINRNVVGTMPLYFIKDYSGGYMAFTLKYGFSVDSDIIAKKFINYVDKIFEEKNAIYTNICSGQSDYDLEYQKNKSHTVILSLLDDVDVMWSSLSAKVRNMVRKASRDGIVIENGIDKVKEFYSIYSERMIDKNIRLHSIEYFYNIIKYLPNNVQIFIAKRNENIIGGMFLINNSDYGIYIYGGSRIIKKQTSPNQLLLWSMVKYCINQGIKQIDLGESVPGTGVHNFKLWFGGETKEIYRYSSERFNYDKLKFSKNKFLFLKRQILRIGSYLLMRVGPKPLKKYIGIWKRSKGSLQ